MWTRLLHGDGDDEDPAGSTVEMGKIDSDRFARLNRFSPLNRMDNN